MSEWPLLELESYPVEIIDGDRGAEYPKTSDFTSSGYCLFLNARNVTTSGFAFDQCAFISEDRDSRLRKGRLLRNDVVATTRGTVGNFAHYDASVPYTHVRINSGMVILRPEAKKLLPRFFYFSVRSPSFAAQIRSLTSGSAQPQLPIRDMRKLRLPLPPFEEQARIVEIIGSLDDKIELNRRMNETLEAMAQAIFRDWFVDFGPTRRKIDGATDPVEIMGGLVADSDRARELAGLFPARIGDDGLPEGWRQSPFSRFVEIIGGGTPKTTIDAYWNGSIPWFSVVDTPPSGSVFVLETEKNITSEGLAESSTRLIRSGTTIISARGTVGNLAVAAQEMTFNQSCYGLQGRDGVGDCYVFLASQQVVERLRGMAHGSVFSTITRQTFDSVSLPRASHGCLGAFEEVVVPLFESIKANGRQNRTLAATRDLLLPKLMSGEIRLRDAEREIEAVA